MSQDIKLPPFRMTSIVSASEVLQTLIDRGIKLSPSLAMVETRNILERMVLDRMQARMDGELRWEYQTFVDMNGPLDGTEDQAQVDTYTDELDNMVERVLLPYEASLTQDFFGRVIVDTRLHRPVVKGPDEIAKLSADFAKTIWLVLSYDGDEDSETHVLSTEKLLLTVGITKDDIIEVMKDMAGSEVTQVSTVQEAGAMRDINELLNEAKAHLGDDFDAKEVKSLFDMAVDTDAVLSASGLGPLGLSADAGPTLRLFAAKFGKDAQDEFVQALNMAPYGESTLGYQLHGDEPDVIVDNDPLGLGIDEEQDPEMRAMMGLPPLPVKAAPAAPTAAPKLPGLPPAPALPKLPTAPAAAPAAPATPRLPNAAQSSAVDKRVLQLIRKYVKTKDEDIATGLGVARQTFINYADDAKKAVLNASDAQREYLSSLLQEAKAAMHEAHTLLMGE